MGWRWADERGEAAGVSVGFHCACNLTPGQAFPMTTSVLSWDKDGSQFWIPKRKLRIFLNKASHYLSWTDGDSGGLYQKASLTESNVSDAG